MDKGYWQEAVNEKPINTRCPECHTLFNVTTGQLKVAAGLVRCGTCLHVFNAAESVTSSIKKTDEQKSTFEESPPPPARIATMPLTRESDKPQKQLQKKPQKQQPTLADKTPWTVPEERIARRKPANTSGSSVARYASYTSTILLLALLAAQTLWFQRTQWLQIDFFRPVYQVLYALNHKVLPSKIAPDLIHTKKFFIQPHDELADAIRISILLENEADFAQPFPALQLIFSDLKGRITAQRTLRADDYINKSLFHQQLMPSKQSIQIQLDMMNPGNRAVSYQLNLLPR
ncbi:DUF3426 domain-containing protein [Neptunomonas antarctica]|uniref:MJ0042 family finger-like domain-containing protein n=1 Tax=Neptunomonas antarctica TaxID=619304 RepID=A0A1N7MZ62_9GAMM|nr:DUF3426 domain-containing protein [Neptunomonas antarctica]SIS91231.1 MJ0042 family finger-like domain-containing protein [Neptunomonas antarctica]